MDFDPVFLLTFPFYEKKLELADPVVSTPLFEAQDYENEALRFLGNGEIEKAVQSLEKAVSIFPGNDSLHCFLGRIFFAQRKFSEAQSAFEKALVLNQHNESAIIDFCKIQLILGDCKNAASLLQRILEFNPRSDEFYAWSGILLLKEEKQIEALQHFEMALKINPKNFTAHLGRGFTFFVIHLFRDAISSFRDALSICPHRPEPYKGLADCFIQVGKEEEYEKYKKFYSVLISKDEFQAL